MRDAVRKPWEAASGRAGEPPEGVGKPCRCPASPAASLLLARWPDGSPARSLWVIISAPWYKAALIAEVSDDTALDKVERNCLQIEKATANSNRAKMLKLADKTSNLHSIIHSPPVDWSPERKREYFKWAGQVVEGCRGVDEYLEKEFDRT